MVETESSKYGGTRDQSDRQQLQIQLESLWKSGKSSHEGTKALHLLLNIFSRLQHWFYPMPHYPRSVHGIIKGGQYHLPLLARTHHHRCQVEITTRDYSAKPAQGYIVLRTAWVGQYHWIPDFWDKENFAPRIWRVCRDIDDTLRYSHIGDQSRKRSGGDRDQQWINKRIQKKKPDDR
jgi:hypothetical protein